MPAGTSKDIVRKVNMELVKMLKAQAVRDKLLEMGGIAVGDAPEEFAAFVQKDTEQWGRVAKSANVRINY